MNRKFIYFINPISGTKNKVLTLEIIQKRTIEKNIPFEILHTNAEGDYEYVKQKIAAENITDVVICGGDG
ncbi:MAG: diacylglycerol kinase family protein, partial [Ferruginibacter sp.]